MDIDSGDDLNPIAFELHSFTAWLNFTKFVPKNEYGKVCSNFWDTI